MAPSQIPLDLPFETAQARDDLIVSASNRLAVEFIDAWPQWPGPCLILAGPTGSGKSHIARAWAERAGAVTLPMSGLDAGALQEASAVVLEDAGSGSMDETALFHLINRLRSEGGHLLMTSRQWPAQWAVELPDLASRLRAAQLVELAEPDDILLRQVIVKLFADRQLPVEPSVVEYLAARMERSLEAANALVAEIDREALSVKAPVSRRLAAGALQRLAMG